MTIRMTIDYLSFFCFQCNGTTVIAEIHRQVMNDPAKFKEVLKKVGFDMWIFLKYCAKKFFPDQKIGSCTDRRYKYHITTKSYSEWNKLAPDLFLLIKKFSALHSESEQLKEVKIRKLCEEFIHEIKTRKDSNGKGYFKSAGPLGATQFIQLAGILGLIPLYCATFAAVENSGPLGPTGFIKKAMIENQLRKKPVPVVSGKKGKNRKKKKRNTASDEFLLLHKNLSSIWGSLITPALLENTLCKLFRSYKRTCKKNGVIINKKTGATEDDPNLSIIEDERGLVESNIMDLAFMNERRKCVQNFYNVRMTGSGHSHLRPMLVMKVSSLSRNKNETMFLTNWTGNQYDINNRHLRWSDSPEERTLDSKFMMSSKLKDLFVYD